MLFEGQILLRSLLRSAFYKFLSPQAWKLFERNARETLHCLSIPGPGKRTEISVKETLMRTDAAHAPAWAALLPLNTKPPGGSPGPPGVTFS